MGWWAKGNGAGEKTPTVWTRRNPTSRRQWPGAGFAISFEMKVASLSVPIPGLGTSLVSPRRVDVPQVMSDA